MQSTSPHETEQRAQRRRTAAAPCDCSAYPFPHRPGSGPCRGPSRYRCFNCGEACESKLVNIGIGYYEYWGSRSFDRRVAEVSDCCEADLIDKGI